MPYSISDVDHASVDAVHRMNERNLPHVNSMPVAYFHGRIGSGGYFRAVYQDRRPAAFLLAMDQAAEYDSLNFLWFRRHYPEFVYIDRVVVDEDHRRAGLGARLYRDLTAWAKGRTPRLACEVNLEPPNPPSVAFHEKLGFAPVGSQNTDGGRKMVSLLTLDLAPG